MITEKEIYELAWNAQLDRWAREQQYAEKSGDKLAKGRAEIEWGRLKHIELLMHNKGF